jgi:hypothetical protein
MEEIRQKITKLREQGWTLSAIAEELGVNRETAYGWVARGHSPANIKLVSVALDALFDKQPPKKRRYPEGHYLQRRKKE